MEGIEHVKELFEEWLENFDSEDDASLDENDEEDKDYFYANTCHVCHCLDKDKRLKRCGSCYMISYCSPSHQAKHWPAHKKLCKVVKEIISKTDGPSVFGKSKDQNLKSWTKMKMNAMLIVSLKLGRHLYESEKNMFKFPRACCVCHETEPNALTNCLSCGNTSFCKDHVTDSAHKSLCPSFFTCYSFDFLKTFTTQMSVSETVFVLLDSEAIDFLHYSQQIVKPPCSMRKFLDIYFKKIVNVRREKSRPEYWDIFISEFFTRPLTLISAMEIIDFEPPTDFNIHILGSNDLELDNISAWEIILHWIPKVQRLKIVLVGPQLEQERLRPDICDRCVSNKKSFIVEVHNTFYHQYMVKGYSKPSIVIGYNIGISECENPGSEDDTWKPTILSLRKNESPFIFTAYSEEEARKDHKRMCLFLGSSTNYSWFDRNQFAGLKPIRDFETEGVFYQNHYLVIYNNLHNKSTKVEEAKPVLKPVKKINSEGKKDKFGLRNNNSVEAKKLATTVKPVSVNLSSTPDKKNVSKTTLSFEGSKNVSKSPSEENKELSVPSTEKNKIIPQSKVENKKTLTSISVQNKKSSFSNSAENKKVSTTTFKENTKDKKSTSESNRPTLEELREENERLREKMKQLQKAVEEEKQGIKLAPERKNLMREMANIEETMQREIQELKEEVMNLEV